MVNHTTNIEIRISILFAYPNTEILRPSLDSQGWTVAGKSGWKLSFAVWWSFV